MIRVRIAPSPTGFMHIGTARTALFNWVFAKKNKGKFILRIEDTDSERSGKEFEESILGGLKWLGLDFDEGPVYQSNRGDIYEKYIKKLLDSGDAFYCYHTKEDLAREKVGQEKRREAPRHICQNKSEKLQPKAETKREEYIIRFDNPGGKIKFNDLVRGEIEFDAGLIGDFSIARDETTPLYNFAAAVDDAEMLISHVIRGEDHISNTPKQLLVLRALGLNEPLYAHLPLILGEDKSKLSKRHGATALLDYEEMGYLPDAVFNFLALLGWNPSLALATAGKPGGQKEIMTREEIIENFSFEGIGKSGAVFSIDKLDWMNGEYIRSTDINELTILCLPYLVKASLISSQISNLKQIQNSKFRIQNSDEEVSFDWVKKIVALEQERMKRISEIGERAAFFFKDKLKYDRGLLRWKDMNDEELKEILNKLEVLLEAVKDEDYKKEKLEKILMPEAEKMGDRGKMLWPLRAALTGRKASPGPFEVMDVLGKQKTLKRIKEAQKL